MSRYNTDNFVHGSAEGVFYKLPPIPAVSTPPQAITSAGALDGTTASLMYATSGFNAESGADNTFHGAITDSENGWESFGGRSEQGVILSINTGVGTIPIDGDPLNPILFPQGMEFVVSFAVLEITNENLMRSVAGGLETDKANSAYDYTKAIPSFGSHYDVPRLGLVIDSWGPGRTGNSRNPRRFYVRNAVVVPTPSQIAMTDLGPSQIQMTFAARQDGETTQPLFEYWTVK